LSAADSPGAPRLAVRLLHPDARAPRRAHPGDAGLDLVAVAGAELAPHGGRAAIPTGLAIAVPHGFAGLVLPRSGLAARHGITLSNAPGLIDAGYRGELVVLMVNLGHTSYTVRPGERIAQLVIAPVALSEVAVIDELPPSDGRGEGGFGSTGV
jgi:dUTP pyrophosphatase